MPPNERRPRAQRLTASEVQQPLGATLPIPRHQRAQRLTASEVQQINIAPTYYVGDECSTPYGIRGSADRHYVAHHAPGMCSTPYGIRGSADKPQGLILPFTACSTPYGIRGSADPKGLGPRLYPYRAQRLTASEVQQDIARGLDNYDY